MLNKVQIIGNLGNDPEMRYMPSGVGVANISVATTTRWKDKQTGEQKEQTEWHRVAMFDKLAEIAGKYLRKGSKVYIEGALRTREYEKDGIKRYSTEVKAREMIMLDSKADRQNDGAGQGQQMNSSNSIPCDHVAPGRTFASTPRPDSGESQPGPKDFDDDIPF